MGADLNAVDLALVTVPQLLAIGAAYGGIQARLTALAERLAIAEKNADKAHNRIDVLHQEKIHARS